MTRTLTPNRQTQWLAGAIAGLASLLTLGGSLILAGHYVQTAANRDASGYDAAQHPGRIGCPDNRDSRAAELAPRRASVNSGCSLANRAGLRTHAGSTNSGWILERPHGG